MVHYDYTRKVTRRQMANAAKHSKPSAKNETSEYATFENALKSVLSVSHSQLKTKLDAEKRKRTKKPSASRASNAKD
jgi:hypothetical protein